MRDRACFMCALENPGFAARAQEAPLGLFGLAGRKATGRRRGANPPPFAVHPSYSNLPDVENRPKVSTADSSQHRESAGATERGQRST